jgi:hypothetical protein
MRSSLMTAAAPFLVLLGFSGVAKAQSPTGSEAQARPHLLTPYGESLVVSGGVTKFFEDSISNLTDIGAFWEARLGFGTRLFVGLEGAYVGSARKIRAPGVDSNLIGHGAEGDLRLNVPYSSGDWLVEPFVFGGLGWTHFHINGMRATTGTLRPSDDILTVPVGAGLTLGYDHILLEGRFTYRQTFNDDLVVFRGDGTLKSWAAGASIGLEF